MVNSGQNRQFFYLCELEIRWMTLKNNMASLIYYVKLWTSFQSHWWIQTGVTVRKHTIQVKIPKLFSSVTSILTDYLKTIGHLFYAISSFVHHFVAIGKFKLESQSTNTQFGWKSTIFLAVWPWNLMHHFSTICEFKLESWSGNSYIGFWPLWPLPLTLTFCMDIASLSSVITSENCIMIRWWGQSAKGVTDGQTDR